MNLGLFDYEMEYDYDTYIHGWSMGQISADYLIFGKANMNFDSPANRLLDNVPNEYMHEYMEIIGNLNVLVKKSAE